jgi:hypothetical protein
MCNVPYLVDLHENKQIVPRKIDFVALAYEGCNLLNDLVSGDLFVISDVHSDSELRDLLVPFVFHLQRNTHVFVPKRDEFDLPFFRSDQVHESAEQGPR